MIQEEKKNGFETIEMKEYNEQPKYVKRKRERGRKPETRNVFFADPEIYAKQKTQRNDDTSTQSEKLNEK